MIWIGWTRVAHCLGGTSRYRGHPWPDRPQQEAAEAVADGQLLREAGTRVSQVGQPAVPRALSAPALPAVPRAAQVGLVGRAPAAREPRAARNARRTLRPQCARASRFVFYCLQLYFFYSCMLHNTVLYVLYSLVQYSIICSLTESSRRINKLIDVEI